MKNMTAVNAAADAILFLTIRRYPMEQPFKGAKETVKCPGCLKEWTRPKGSETCCKCGITITKLTTEEEHEQTNETDGKSRNPS